MIEIELDEGSQDPKPGQTIHLEKFDWASEGGDNRQLWEGDGTILETHDRPWDDPGPDSVTGEQAIQEQEMAGRELELEDCTCRKWGWRPAGSTATHPASRRLSMMKVIRTDNATTDGVDVLYRIIDGVGEGFDTHVRRYAPPGGKVTYDCWFCPQGGQGAGWYCEHIRAVQAHIMRGVE